MRLLLTAFLAICLTFNALAQVEAPQPSPKGKIVQTVGLAEITIEYSRPAAKGRVIFGDLVPFDEVWRLGANASTKITFSEDAVISGQNIAKGTYTLAAIPGRDMWTFVINKNLNLFTTDDYNPGEDVLRFTAKPTTVADKTESLTFSIGNLNDKGGDVIFNWDNCRVAFPVGFDTNTRVMASIKKTMDGPGANDYYQAAGYYLTNNIELGQALVWVNKAIEKNGEKYWYLRRKALLEAALGDYKAAIASANKSIEVAKKEGDDSYVRSNTKSITEWTAKIK